ncbi:MAG: putative nuclease [Candidatus Woesebacteria bacterium GW2011_GWB1_39_10]|uniref:Putative nuclease n=3 Tax=Candidatus Woeseibacteriota TaxID=1752722 RepID=A0A0G0XWQ4_9BACT|nr:MAG: putative nuclease [Candidatus Woesebacteria bacterium GW2011_GWB1_39_10]KKR92332.1 MAG: putative nuclease [Candidatus Woesebacteria bacterium GW2011_GWA1_41_13b]
MAKKLTAKDLFKKKIPGVLIPGLLLASLLGWKGINGIKNYDAYKSLFPSSGVVETIEDGDTFTLKGGVKVRLLGVNSPDRGQKNYDLAGVTLSSMVKNKKIYLEYDRYQDDKFGRVLAWIWIDCESSPKFLPADYMYKSDNESNTGLKDNPEGCKKGRLVNEELVKAKLAVPVVYKDRGELKYQKRLQSF